ncbi:hypothetical protein HK101_000914 [Irineochytrium annulatum]|nr:hypothetical protein HK101_000914 [Irineochytrium annulatum]
MSTQSRPVVPRAAVLLAAVASAEAQYSKTVSINSVSSFCLMLPSSGTTRGAVVSNATSSCNGYDTTPGAVVMHPQSAVLSAHVVTNSFFWALAYASF